MRVEKRNRKFGSFFGNHLSGSFIMSVAKEFTTDRNTDVKTAGNRVIEGCNSLLVAYTRDSFFDILMYKLYQKFRMISIINYEL